MMKQLISIVSIFMLGMSASAQYAPAAGQQGSTAIHKDTSSIKAWANACSLQLAWQDIADTTLGKVSVGDNTSAVGAANGNVVSLGDGGSATLTFAKPIVNGEGFDFAVFENGFTTGGNKAFLELAFVEVSSDGVNYTRFAATTHIQDTTQLAMEGVDCTFLNNFAGKYTSGYGTPFDLQELANEPNLDINNITHVRIIDVVGSINDLYATYDSEGNKVNDPYPTPFPSSGFDLDAIGVIHQKEETSTSINDIAALNIGIYPNPAKDVVHLQCAYDTQITMTDVRGKVCYQSSFINHQTIDVSQLSQGMYILHANSKGKTATHKLFVE